MEAIYTLPNTRAYLVRLPGGKEPKLEIDEIKKIAAKRLEFWAKDRTS
jgi:hypothetical protein